MRKLSFIAFLFLLSCSNGLDRIEKPQNLIPEKEMVDLLTELVKLESHVVNHYVQINKYHQVMTLTGDSLLKAKNIDLERFENSMDYYGSRQEEMQKIYSDVLEELNNELGELKEEQN